MKFTLAFKAPVILHRYSYYPGFNSSLSQLNSQLVLTECSAYSRNKAPCLSLMHIDTNMSVASARTLTTQLTYDLFWWEPIILCVCPCVRIVCLKLIRAIWSFSFPFYVLKMQAEPRLLQSSVQYKRRYLW